MVRGTCAGEAPPGGRSELQRRRAGQEAKRIAAELELEERTRRRFEFRERAGLTAVQEDLPGTLADLCRWWLMERCSETSREVEGRRLKKHVIDQPAGALPIALVRPTVIENLLCDMERRGSAPGSVNKLRSVLHTVFSRARRAGRWVGENPVAATEPRKVPKRVHVSLTPKQIGRMLEQVPEDWRPLFACGPALGLRKGELFALRKTDVDLVRATITVCRSHERETTKTGAAAVLPIPTALRPWLERQLREAPGPLLFPAPDGSQRSREADPQKILRSALSRVGIVEGWEHRCRWCGHSERAADNERRFCPNCLKRTNGSGKPLAHPRGRALWPKAIPLRMRFHDLRHGFATELLRRGVDVHRVQRLMRHSDVRVTTGIYGHLIVEDLRAAVEMNTKLQALTGPENANPNAPDTKFAAFLLQSPKTAIRRTRIQPLKLLKFLGKMLHGRSRV
jgi:integrase